MGDIGVFEREEKTQVFIIPWGSKEWGNEEFYKWLEPPEAPQLRVKCAGLLIEEFMSLSQFANLSFSSWMDWVYR